MVFDVCLRERAHKNIFFPRYWRRANQPTTPNGDAKRNWNHTNEYTNCYLYSHTIIISRPRSNSLHLRAHTHICASRLSGQWTRLGNFCAKKGRNSQKVNLKLAFKSSPFITIWTEKKTEREKKRGLWMHQLMSVLQQFRCSFLSYLLTSAD